MSYAAHGLSDFDGDQRDQRSFTYWSTLWLTECHRITTPGGTVMVFIDWRQIPSITDAIQAAGWIWRGIIAWHKPAVRVQMGRFTNSCEYHSKRIHITEKPVPLLRKLTKIVPHSGIILDPFCGSGSTGTAALLEGHRFIGIELSRHYAEQTATRLHTTQTPPNQDKP